MTKNAIFDGTNCSYTNPNGKNATPWQSDVDDAKRLNTAIAVLLILGGILAAIGAYLKEDIWTAPAAAILLWAAIACALAAVVLGAMMIADGNKISDAGGSLQGDAYKSAGEKYICVAVVTMILAFCTGASFANATFIELGAIMCSFMALSDGFLSPPPPASPPLSTTTTINCPNGEKPVNTADSNAGCQAIPSAATAKLDPSSGIKHLFRAADQAARCLSRDLVKRAVKSPAIPVKWRRMG